MGQIYCIRNKINGKCYVGQTTRTFQLRYSSWVRWPHSTNNPILKKAHAKYGLDSFEVEILEDGIDNIEVLNKSEELWAERLNSYTPNGYNIKKCGDNRKYNPGVSHPSAQPVICSNGKTYKSMLAAANDLGVSPGLVAGFFSRGGKHINGHVFAKIGTELPPIPADMSKYNKPIAIKCSNGQSFHSVFEASKKLGIDDYSILRCLDGRRKTAKGLTFCRIADELPKKRRIFCSNGQSFPSARKAALALGCSRVNISLCCKNPQELCGGYNFWIGYE